MALLGFIVRMLGRFYRSAVKTNDPFLEAPATVNVL
jgi:hypothetical protein